MIIGNSISEAGILLVLGAALLATSVVLRRVLKVTVRVLNSNQQVNLGVRENLTK